MIYNGGYRLYYMGLLVIPLFSIFCYYFSGRENEVVGKDSRFELPVVEIPGLNELLWNIVEEEGDIDGGLREFIVRQLEELRDKLQTVVVNKRKDDGYERANATYLVLCRNNEVYELIETIQNMQDRFNSKYNYDWVFLNDKPFDGRFLYLISQFIPQGKLSFGQILPEHWGYPDWVNQTYAQEQRTKLKEQGVFYGDSESYRHMCRYYLGYFYKHPLVAQYQYYWRVEPGVKFYCDLDYDAFKFMATNKKRYGFVLSMFEYEQTIPSLWGHFESFIMQHNDTKNGDMMEFVLNDDVARSYNLCHFWSNFEIADLSIFNNPDYEALFEHLDQTGGFFYERWGDAPVHTLAVLWFLAKSDIWWFRDIGYYHGPYMQCPRSFQTRIQNKCSCDPDEDFLFTFISCTHHFVNLLGIKV